MGLIAEARHSIAPAFVVPLIAYVFIAGYAFAGATVRNPANALQIQSRG
jgi:fucose permease